jgi:sugar/nucleoside kinase (ribokinase family)
MTLTVVGSIGIDTVETPFGKAEDVPGGSALYFSLAASHFTKVQVAANLGTDFPEQAWDPVRKRGADLSGLRVFEDQNTFRWSGSYAGNMNEAETLLTELNVLAEPPVVPEAYQGSAFAFLANMGTDVQLRMLEELKADLVFADTMNLWIETQRENLDELLTKIDGFILNDAEARMLTRESNLIRAGGALLEMGPKVVVLKKGEHGAFLFTNDFHFALPSYPTARVVDPTGAGDSFAGGFLGSLAEMGDLTPENLRRAMAYGTVAASMTVEEFSTKGLSNCDRGALDNRFEELCNFVRI